MGIRTYEESKICPCDELGLKSVLPAHELKAEVMKKREAAGIIKTGMPKKLMTVDNQTVLARRVPTSGQVSKHSLVYGPC